MFTTNQTVHIKPTRASAYPPRARVEGTTYKVKRCPAGERGKNYTLEPISGPGMSTAGVRAAEELIEAGECPTAVTVLPNGTTLIPFVAEKMHDVGAVVEFNDESATGLWVVIEYSRNGHRLAPLGGGSMGKKNIHGDRLTAFKQTVKPRATGGHSVTLTPTKAA
jgi:hypothetical protein